MRQLHEPRFPRIRLEWKVMIGKVTVYEIRFCSIQKSGPVLKGCSKL